MYMWFCTGGIPISVSLDGNIVRMTGTCTGGACRCEVTWTVRLGTRMQVFRHRVSACNVEYVREHKEC